MKIVLQIGKKREYASNSILSSYVNFLGYLPFDVDLTTYQGKLKAHGYIKGLSQKQLRKISGVDGATVCSWELEENKAHKVILEKRDMMW